MKDRFLKDLGIYGLSMLLVRLINFLLIPVYARVLSPGAYGAMDLVNTLTYVTGVFLFMELYQAVARFFAEAGEERRRHIVGTGFWYYLAAMLPVLLAVWVLRDSLSKWMLDDATGGNVIVMAFAAAFALAAFNYLQNVQRYALESTAYAIANVACVITTVLVSIALVVYARQGLMGVFAGQLAGAGVGLVFAVYRNYKAILVPFDMKLWKELARFSAPLIVSAVVLYLMNYIDRWLIKDTLGLEAVGIYAVLFRIAAVPMLAMNIVSSSLLPHIYNGYKDPGKALEIGDLYRFIWAGGLLLVSWMAWLSPEILYLMAGSQYSNYAYLFPVVLISGFLLHFSYLFVGLYLGHKTYLTAYLYSGGLVLVFVMNGVLLPVLGLTGAAISSILTTLSLLTCQWYFSQKAYAFPMATSSMAINGLITFLPLLVYCYLGRLSIDIGLPLRLTIAFIYTIWFLFQFRHKLAGFLQGIKNK